MFSGVGRRLIPLLILALCLVAATAFAQTRTGTIDGTIRDATGQVLPGVSVTLEGQVLVASQVTTTSAVGIYRFLSLPPGEFTLRFELSGFNTQVNQAVRVSVGMNTAINVTLELSSVQEVITVVGESPMVDTKSTVIGATFDASLLEAVPSARDVWSLLEHQAPGVTTSRLDVGGSETGLQAVYSARGTNWQQNSYYLNGVNVTCPAALGASGYYYDYDSFEEVQVETGSHPASVNAPGVYMNMVTKTGGNTFAGGVSYYYQSNATQNENLDQELMDRGASSAAFDFLSDASAQFGGPIVKDRSNFFFSWRDERVHRFVPGFPAGCDPDQPDTCITEDTDMWQFVIKNTTQLNDKNRVGFEWHEMSYWKPTRGASASRSPEATWIEDDTFRIIQAEWTSTLSDVALLDARFSHLKVFFPTFIQPDATLQAAQDITLGTFFNARDRDVQRDRKRYAFKGDLTYFKDELGGAAHEFKFGLEWAHNPISNLTKANDDVFLRFNDGVADQVDLRNTPRVDEQALDQLSFYVDDIITSGRLTLKLGLRFDKYEGYLPEQNSPAGSFVPARTFPEQRNLLDLASFAPRLGLVYGLNERGSTALKASWGRYYHQFSTGFANFANPNGNLRDRYEWTDVNGDAQWQNGEQGTLLSTQLGSSNRIDTDLKHSYEDEFTIGIEHEIGPDMAISATYSNRRGRNLTDSINAAIPFSAYTPETVIDPGPDGTVGTGDDGGPVTVFNLNPESVGNTDLFLTNPEDTLPNGETFENSSDFHGFEITFSKRFRDRWSAIVSYSYNNTDLLTRGGQFEGQNNGFFQDPNNLINSRGKSFYDRTNQFKFASTWQLPYDLRLSGVIRAQTGQPIARTFVVRGLNQGSVTILAEKMGDQRLPFVSTADVAISYDIRLGSRGQVRLSPELNMFNIFNSNTETVVVTSSGGRYLNVDNFLSPRIFRFGVRVKF